MNQPGIWEQYKSGSDKGIWHRVYKKKLVCYIGKHNFIPWSELHTVHRLVPGWDMHPWPTIECTYCGKQK